VTPESLLDQWVARFPSSKWHPLPVWDDVIDARIQYGSTLSRYGSLETRLGQEVALRACPREHFVSVTKAEAMENKEIKKSLID
jgi:hypothetical protein